MSSQKPPGHQQDVLPASQFLQERLQERRAQNTRPRRARHTDFGPRQGRDDDIFINEAQDASRNRRMYDSSPLAFSVSGSDAGSSNSRRRALGARDMDDHMDRLSKQNFALKLELDHRRDHTAKLQEQLEEMRERVERAERLEEEHAELLKINTQLVDELEKRDKAVEEAMDIICDLEDKVADLEDRSSETRPSTANADSGYAGTDIPEQPPPSSPPELTRPPNTPRINIRGPSSQPASTAAQKLQGIMNGATPAKPRREPSILSHQKPSTHALRSVYLETAKELHSVKSFHSLLSKRESAIEEDELPEDVLNSPRLSVLSESSFRSMYSPKKQISPERDAWMTKDNEAAMVSSPSNRTHLRQDSIKRVSQWISDRNVADSTPSKSNSLSVPLAERTQPGLSSSIPPPPLYPKEGQYQSLNDALVSPAAASQDLTQSPAVPRSTGKQRSKRSQPRPTSFAGPIFGEPLLPPTPDSMSTRMLRESRSSIMDDRSLLDTTPAAVKGFDALEPGIRTAPRQMRSSMELNGAYASNMEFRNTLFHNDSSSDGEDDDDARSETLREFAFDYNGYPDGQSILMGTPSRFLSHAKSPAENLLFDGNDLSPPIVPRPPPARRQSSNEISPRMSKPRLNRVETSPTIFSTIGKMVTGNVKVSAESVTSPRSIHSGSSSNRTIVCADEYQNRATSPEATRRSSRVDRVAWTSPPRTRTSPSPARTLGQKTQQFLRRMSNSHGSDRNEIMAEKSLLPKLTSTPSSAYTNHPSDIKRPRTSHGHDTSRSKTSITSTPQRPPSSNSRMNPRPSLPAAAAAAAATPTKVDPGFGNFSTVIAEGAPDANVHNGPGSKKTFFRRSQSVRNTPNNASNSNHNSMTAESPGGGNFGKTGSASANAGPGPGPTMRRGSFKDAVLPNRRPWR